MTYTKSPFNKKKEIKIKYPRAEGKGYKSLKKENIILTSQVNEFLICKLKIVC